MRTAEFDYDLPPELIAQTPIEPRDAARLMVLHRRDGRIEHRTFRDIGDYLHPGDLLVANESRVIPARLCGHKQPTGGRVELLLIRKLDELEWEVLLKPGRRVKPGATIAIHGAEGAESGIVVEVTGITPGGGRTVRFPCPVEGMLDTIGVIPLPPYIHTPLSDKERYQTVYASVRGSVAAPTAGLHFTPELLADLKRHGIGLTFVTLHIGMDTFLPVEEEHIEQHQIHSEYAELPAETAAQINATRAANGRVVAVGTTSVRVLETAGRAVQERHDQLQPCLGMTNLFIYPGFQYRVVDVMITNFHLPRSTLLMLVSAFAGKELIDRAYREAVEQRYRFFSLGDAMLIL